MSEVVVVVVAQAKPGQGDDALAPFQALAVHLLEFRRSAADVWAVPAQILVLDAAPCGDPVKGALAGG